MNKAVIMSDVEQSSSWTDREKSKLTGNNNAVHLAIFNEPYLTYILDGQKTIETRFSKNKIPPYKGINTGDVILLKKSSGPIVGICEVKNAWSYQLDPNSWNEIKNQYADEICATNKQFWEERKNKSFATLIRIHNVKRIPPVSIAKKDRRAWIVF